MQKNNYFITILKINHYNCLLFVFRYKNYLAIFLKNNKFHQLAKNSLLAHV